MQSVKAVDPGGGCYQQCAIWPLSNHADVVFGQPVLYLPIMLLILRKAWVIHRHRAAGARDTQHDQSEYPDIAPRLAGTAGYLPRKRKMWVAKMEILSQYLVNKIQRWLQNNMNLEGIA